MASDSEEEFYDAEDQDQPSYKVKSRQEHDSNIESNGLIAVQSDNHALPSHRQSLVLESGSSSQYFDTVQDATSSKNPVMLQGPPVVIRTHLPEISREVPSLSNEVISCSNGWSKDSSVCAKTITVTSEHVGLSSGKSSEALGVSGIDISINVDAAPIEKTLEKEVTLDGIKLSALPASKVDIEDTPAPVAPPRRRKTKHKSEENASPREALAELDNVHHTTRGGTVTSSVQQAVDLSVDAEAVHAEGDDTTPSASPSHRATLMVHQAPCICVSSSSDEMAQVLESGNSLEVVFNDDHLARKSGGIPLDGGSPRAPPVPPRPGLVRCNSISGRPLTDAEILEQVIVKNLDTGEAIPLSKAEEMLPKCTDPLALHIMRLTSDVPSGAAQNEEDGHFSDSSSTASSIKMQDKKQKLKKFFGKTVHKIRAVAEAKGQGRRGIEEMSSEEEDEQHEGFVKYKNHRAIKDRLQFNRIKLLQDLSGEHMGAVWTMKFSLCGKLLATAGQDNVVRVWVLKSAHSNFEEMRLKYSRPSGRKSPTGSMSSSASGNSAEEEPVVGDLLLACAEDEVRDGPFRRTPFVSYHGHTSDVLDLSWSKNYFLLSSSMDKTVRLWHISRQECLCCFQHVDFVTAICFHPRDDRYFLSGSLDGKLRLWNIPEKKVALWNEIDGSGTSLITAANFCQNGKLAVVGTYDGRCIFYDTERLKYHTQITVRSSRGKNARGRKVSGIEPMPGEDKVLITSNDSRIRLYDMKDHSLYCKYRGLENESSQIKASFSHDGKLILCGSEDKFVHIWRTHHEVPNVRRDRNEYYECFSAHDAVVTSAIFAPYPMAIVEQGPDDIHDLPLGATAADMAADPKGISSRSFEVLVTADWQGGVKLFVNR